MGIAAVELFCGAGLMGEGFSRAGFEAVYAADLDTNAVASYNRNLKKKVAAARDVKAVQKDIRCDVIVAGPPCQGFSTLGKRDKKDARNKLSLLLLGWAKSTLANVVVVENVPQFLNSQYHTLLVKDFHKMGYESVSWLLNASDYGTPQHRKRSFTIFSRIGLPHEPKPVGKKIIVEEAFDGLGKVSDNQGMHAAAPLSDLALERIRLVPPNGSKIDLMKIAPHLCPESWFKMGNQAVDVWGRMNLKAPANTIRCCFSNPSKGRYIHPTEDRVITLREGARLQGIPDNWDMVGSRTSVARQIGNGVPIPLAEAVAKAVAKLF
jgi:DNA (cytosine-5)-methyltransferase 1